MKLADLQLTNEEKAILLAIYSERDWIRTESIVEEINKNNLEWLDQDHQANKVG